MCGIAGYFSPGQDIAPERLGQMCGALRHRGPDDEGRHWDGPCGIAMRRLSIVDLGGGHQPISNEDGSIWVVFNGEIYNYRELRQDLIARGHRFRTNSDTETLVHLYEEWGPDGIARLRGMFAFAIWDARRRRLLLARDRFGKKPLYIAETDGSMYFASELKALRAVPEIHLSLDEDAIRLYLRLSYIPEPWTPFQAVRKLPPGTWIQYSETGEIVRGRYWEMPVPASGAPELTEENARTQLLELLDEAVRLRTVADVPIGAFLSGGVDSSAVVASLALQSDQPVRTFSVGFEEAEANELPYARLIAARYRTDHHELMLRADSMDLIEKVIAQFDEPLGDTAAIPTYLLAEFAARHVKVALSGDGGDEIFAGYESIAGVARWSWADNIPQSARDVLTVIAPRIPDRTYGKNLMYALGRPSALERYFEMNTTPHSLRASLLCRDWDASSADAFASSWLPEDADNLTQALYFEAVSKLPGNMLTKLDRMSMAHSLEVRCPLLDHKLAEFAISLPHAMKLRHGRGKAIFLDALRGRLPEAILNRRKMGFAFPIGSWFRGSLRPFLRERLLDPSFLARGIVSKAGVLALLEEHNAGRRDQSHWLYMLLALAVWLNTFDNRRPDSIDSEAAAAVRQP